MASNALKSQNKPSSKRPPSLNQLVAKLNINNPSASSSTATNSSTSSSGSATNSGSVNGVPGRPRLAASVLRTGSTTSLATTASSAADSMAVQAPSTRSASPSTTNGGGTPTTPSSDLPSTLAGSTSGEPLTSEGLDRLNEQEGEVDKSALTAAAAAAANTATSPSDTSSPTDGTAKPARKVGYKNIPSLDAIAARLAEARQQLSVDGTSKPPEADFIEDPKTPGVPIKAPEHPLQYGWTIYHDTKAKFPATPHIDANFANAGAAGTPTTATSTEPPATTKHEYEANLTTIGEFNTVESFCRYFNWLKPPSHLPRNSNYHLFKTGIKPMWEDPSNANGGKWVLTMKNNPALLDRCWNWLAMALVGEELEEGDELCGAVVSLRSKVDRIQVWTRGKDDAEKLNGIGKKLIKLLDVSEADGIGLEFQYNTDDRPLPNKFISIQAVPSSSFRSSFGPGSAGGPGGGAGRGGAPGSGDFSGFGSGGGIGGGVPGWRGSSRGGGRS